MNTYTLKIMYSVLWKLTQGKEGKMCVPIEDLENYIRDEIKKNIDLKSYSPAPFLSPEDGTGIILD